MFCRKELPYLGYVIMPGTGVKANPKKVESINNIPVPKNRKQLVAFLQSVGFYRSLIPYYNTLTLSTISRNQEFQELAKRRFK